MIPFLGTNAFVFCGLNAEEIPEIIVHPLVPPASNSAEASNSVDVQIDDGEEPYGTARAIKSDDDRPIRLNQMMTTL